MSVSLYYEAVREQPLTAQEAQHCNEIVEKYSQNYPYGEKYEDFCVYDNQKVKEFIFSGATKLPLDNDQVFFDVSGYWLECLDEITRILPDAQWHVHIDDMEFYWNDEQGWRPDI